MLNSELKLILFSNYSNSRLRAPTYTEEERISSDQFMYDNPSFSPLQFPSVRVPELHLESLRTVIRVTLKSQKNRGRKNIISGRVVLMEKQFTLHTEKKKYHKNPFSPILFELIYKEKHPYFQSFNLMIFFLNFSPSAYIR